MVLWCDGAMKGPNIDATADLARAVDIPVIASGGVSSMDDLRAQVPQDGRIVRADDEPVDGFARPSRTRVHHNQ